VLCLYEGVATGAADGYARIAGKPAATLLHLGAGLSNGSANLHNARRACSPVVNIVGDQCDLSSFSRCAPEFRYCRARGTCLCLGGDRRDRAKCGRLDLRSGATKQGWPRAVRRTLILPADCAWSECGDTGPVLAAPVRSRPDSARIAAVAKALKAAKKPAILVGSRALTEEGLIAGGRLASAGVRVIIDTFVARQPRGAGRFAPHEWSTSVKRHWLACRASI